MAETMVDDDSGVAVEMGRAGKALLWVCKLAAAIGGLLFVVLVVVSVISIVGRKLFSAPVPGDMEILQLVAAAAAANFFAYCHLIHGDLKVDLFTAALPRRWIHLLETLGSLAVAAFGAILAWRIGAGAASTLESGETSAILAWQVGWFQAAMVPGFALLALSGLYLAGRNLSACLSSQGEGK